MKKTLMKFVGVLFLGMHGIVISQSIDVVTPDKVEALAVRNNKRLVVFLENASDVKITQNIMVLDNNYSVELPANSLCAFAFDPIP
ncbi:hypothetical protein ACFSKN_03135 [Mariniflexile gromovii]|uniref:Uncharacterized protein n=1 Tax=Mariniflexile gromovii TaxID=362523 RepID=A0ABS4BXW4_9FLAO|nr:hypothetical protein [Mariniflexile gromovii]MBP0905431.1 hypothetical protein [Mariniflexile gromovii]